MPKIMRNENYRVVIEPRGLGDFGFVRTGDWIVSNDKAVIAEMYRERCEEILADVKRHVDSVGSASVECDAVGYCSHCGWQWTEDSADYNGGCCAKDQEAEDARQEGA